MVETVELGAQDRKRSLPWQIVVVFCTAILLTNITAQWQLSFYRFTITVALLIYPITFLITDYVSELYGKRKCQRLVLIGLVFSILPSLIFSTARITIGSLLAYFVAQFHDIWAFDWWKHKTHGRHLWLRNNASTIISQLIDTIIFTIVSFYSVLDSRTIWEIMYTEYPLKVGYALADTIPLYILVRLNRKQLSCGTKVKDEENA